MTGEHTFDDIDRAAGALEAMVIELDIATLPGAGAARLATRLVTAERVLAACRSRAMKRATEANQWRHAGERSPAAWAAKVTGTTTGQAAAELETAAQLEKLPATQAARTSGRISELQARELASAAITDPGAEAMLLRRAETDDAQAFRRRCAEVRAAAERDEAAARERIHRDRRFRSWIDAEGAFCFAGRGLVEDGAALLAAMKPYQDAAFDAARRRGAHEGTDAYAYDGLMALAGQRSSGAELAPARPPGLGTWSSGSRTPACPEPREGGEAHADPRERPRSRPRAKLIVRIDHTALVRGHTVPGETCELMGLGPIPVATARELARDAFLTAVLTDGVDIQKVVHLGRAATAHQRTALEARGTTCAVPGCGTTTRLEIDHVDGWAITRRTHIDQLDWLCHFHHYQKTNHSYRLQGPPGDRTWHPPDESAVLHIGPAQEPGRVGSGGPPARSS